MLNLSTKKHKNSQLLYVKQINNIMMIPISKDVVAHSMIIIEIWEQVMHEHQNLILLLLFIVSTPSYMCFMRDYRRLEVNHTRSIKAHETALMLFVGTTSCVATKQNQ